MGSAVRLRLLDPGNAVRLDMRFDPLSALLTLALAYALFFALTLLLSRSKRTARVALRDKGALLLAGVGHMALSRDKAFKLSAQPDAGLLVPAEPARTRRIILVRHGESLWNSVFNKAPMALMPLRLARALVYEALVLLQLDSVLFDSPLSAEGRAQARDLADFLARAHASPSLVPPGAQADVAAVFGEGPPSVLVSSMLRRAVSTGARGRGGRRSPARHILSRLRASPACPSRARRRPPSLCGAAWLALEERLRAAPDGAPMFLHSALQEMSRNVDTLSIAHTRTAPLLSRVNGDASTVPNLSAATDARFNGGNKAVRAVATERIGEFGAWCFEREEPTVIVVGHSLLFRTMFGLWLPREVQHVAKAKKLVNCGVVAFTLTSGQLPGGAPYFRIEPDSVTVVYGGFGGK